MKCSRVSLLVLSLVALSSWAQRNPDLEKAQELLGAKKYDAALKSIEAAAKKGGLDRESLLTLLESRGVAQAALGQTEAAEKSFRSVLQLEPKRDLDGKYTGKIPAVIASAKEWFKANGGIELGPLEPGVADGRIKQVAFFVRNDPLKLITKARIYTRQDGGVWRPIETTVINGAAAADVDAKTIEWWGEALSDRNDQLMFLGAAGRPIKQSAPAAVAAEPTKPADAPVATTTTTAAPSSEPAAVTTARTEQPSAVRPVGFVLLGVGVVAAGVGIGLGVASNAEAEAIRAANVPGSDQQALYQRDQARITQAGVANGLIIGGGVVAAAGVIMAIVGGSSSSDAPAVTFVPTQSGGAFSVSGRF